MRDLKFSFVGFVFGGNWGGSVAKILRSRVVYNGAVWDIRRVREAVVES